MAALPLQKSARSPPRKRKHRLPGTKKQIPGHLWVRAAHTGPVRSPGWVLEGSLARFFGCRDMALELARGADFPWKSLCAAWPGDLRGSPGRRLPDGGLRDGLLVI